MFQNLLSPEARRIQNISLIINEILFSEPDSPSEDTNGLFLIIYIRRL